VNGVVAAIDCGTNSIRLLVARPDEAGRLIELDRRMTIVRLGEGVDRTGRLSDAALERTFAACQDYARIVESLGAERVRFVATSASRDAQNRQVFVDGVMARIGVEPEVVTGDLEAALSFAGATSGLADDARPPFLVVDIGGGSTEFVLGDAEPTAARSVDMGCVRLTERYLLTDPPSPAEVKAATDRIDALIDFASESVPLSQVTTLVGLAGSVTTVAAIALGLDEYDSVAIHGSRIAADDVHTIADRLLAMNRIDRAAIGVMHPGRVDVIGGGALVLSRILRRLEDEAGVREVLVSERDILDGIALSLLA
jgi:exopolyphosphatase/guanosine-5'-triphosphate,3'-diphosphate pyrophosphatase